MNGDSVIPGDRLMDGDTHCVEVEHPGPVDHRCDDVLVLVILLDEKCGGRPGADRRVAALDGELEIVGMVVLAPNDDEILRAADDEELTVPQEAKVTGPEKR